MWPQCGPNVAIMWPHVRVTASYFSSHADFWKQKRVWMWLGNAIYWFSCRKMYIFDSASGEGPKVVGWMVRRPGEGLLLIGNSDLLTTCGAANAGPFSPTRLAPHSWRADPWSSSNLAPSLARQAFQPIVAEGHGCRLHTCRK